MPPMSGITMSMVTRSGCSSLYLATASAPVWACPTTEKPALDRMSDNMVRMKTASSQIRTVRSMFPLCSREQSAQNAFRVECQKWLIAECAYAQHIIACDVVGAQRVGIKRQHAGRFPRNGNNLINQDSDAFAGHDHHQDAMLGTLSGWGARQQHAKIKN